MTINKIEVSLFPSESAVSKYPIKRPTIIFEKRLILAWRVTYVLTFQLTLVVNCWGHHTRIMYRAMHLLLVDVFRQTEGLLYHQISLLSHV